MVKASFCKNKKPKIQPARPAEIEFIRFLESMSCVTSPWVLGRDGERGAKLKYFNFLNIQTKQSAYTDGQG